MNKQEIRDSFKTVSKDKGLFDAYAFLFLHYKVEDLVEVGIKKGKNKKELFNSTEFFQFLLEHPVAQEKILNSNKWGEFLYWLISASECKTIENFRSIAENFPEKFIASVRWTRSYLNTQTHLLLQKINLPDEYSNHQEVWKKLFTVDTEMWNKICSFHTDWALFNAQDFLGNLTNWLEIKRFQDTEGERIELLAKTYSFIISYYLDGYYDKTLTLDKEKLENSFWESFGELNAVLSKSFDLILEYVYFEQECVTPYSFDHNLDPTISNKKIHFLFKNFEKYRNWEKNGLRYNLNKNRYIDFAGEICSYRIHEEGMEIPEGNNEQDKLNNLECYHNTVTIFSFLKDLCLLDIKVNSKEIDVRDILQPLISYSFNKKIRYEYELEKLHENSNSWQWSYFQLNEENKKKDLDNDPYFFMSKDEFINRNIKAMPKEFNNLYAEIINEFGFKPTKKYKFNRYNNGYDVWYKPFILLGNFLFCPMMFFARNDWFYPSAQVVLKSYIKHYNSKLRKDSADEMEVYLLELFKEFNSSWNCVIPPEINGSGDIDLIISDANNSLLIQLKRTYFKLNLKETYFDSVNVDRKAIYQLNEGEKYFLKNKSSQFSENRIKWLVSTSFENVNKLYDHCRKVNYLDLVWILKNKKFLTIAELNKYVCNDSIMEEETSF